MGHIDSPGRIKPRRDGPWQLLLEYLSIAGVFFFTVNALGGVQWHEAVVMLKSPTGQALLLVFGGVIVLALWMIGRFRDGS